MRLGPAFFVARRSLAGKGLPGEEQRGRRYLRGAVLGVALSLVPLVLVLIVADGMIEGITGRYIEVGTYHIRAIPLVQPSGTRIEEAAAAIRALSLPGLRGVYPELQGPAVAIASGRSAGALVRAVSQEFLADTGTESYLKPLRGELKIGGSNDILLGEALARSLGVEVGDVVSVVTARAGGSAGGYSSFEPRIAAFRVKGIVSTGYRELDALWAFVSYASGTRFLQVENSSAFIGIKTSEPYADLGSILAEIRKIPLPGWSIMTWPDIDRAIFKSFATTRSLLLLIMALAVGVAAVNVGSALSMLVFERRRDIAILKSAGAGSPFISLTFLLAGLATGAAGSFLGIGLGAFLAWRINDLIGGIESVVNFMAALAARLSGASHAVLPLKLLDPAYYLERIPVRIDPAELVLIACLSLILCILASILPARRASRLPPLEIFRKI